MSNKLYDIFKDLIPPSGKLKNHFKAEIIEDSLHRIAVNSQSQLALLLKTTDKLEENPRSFVNFEIRHSVECLIEKDANAPAEERGTFSIIIFKNTSSELIKRFLEIISLMLNDFKSEISINDIEKFVEELIEIFKPEEGFSRKTLIGLIGELITIYVADDKNKLISAWHTKNSENFDFYLNGKALEIKTTEKNIRKHRFKINQLSNSNFKIFIGSILIKEKINGSNIEVIYDSIRKSISNIEIEKKFMTNIYKIIKTNNVSEFEIDLDYCINSFSIYDANKIPKIVNPPTGVTEVKFNSDLSSIEKTEIYLDDLF